MAEWELTVGDETRYYLVAILEERRIAAGGDIRSPSLLLPFGWKEILARGERQEAWGSIMAVSIDLHPDQTQHRYWIRTGLLPATRATTPTLPLTHPIVEALSLMARTNQDGDTILNMSVQVLATLATEQNVRTNPRIYWHQTPQSVHIGAAQWQRMLKQWAPP